MYAVCVWGGGGREGGGEGRGGGWKVALLKDLPFNYQGKAVTTWFLCVSGSFHFLKLCTYLAKPKTSPYYSK